MTRLEELTGLLLDGTISDEELREWEQAAAEDPSARETVCALMEVDGALRGSGAVPDIASAVLGRLKAEKPAVVREATMSAVRALSHPRAAGAARRTRKRAARGRGFHGPRTGGARNGKVLKGFLAVVAVGAAAALALALFPRTDDVAPGGSPSLARPQPAHPAEAVDREPRGGPVARVAMAQGSVECLRDGSTEWTPATVGLELGASDRLRTQTGLARVEFVSGTQLYLNASTRLAFRRERVSAPHSVDVRHGEIYVDTGAAVPGAAISTPHGRFVDLGTRFAVEVRAGASTLLVAEGTVRAATDADSVKVEASHEAVLVGRDSPPGVPVPVTDVESRLAWTLGDIAPATPALAEKPDLPPAAPARPGPVLSGWAAGWSYEAAGEYPRVFDYRGRRAVWHTHPVDRVTPFKWKRSFALEKRAQHTLLMDVTTHPFDGQVASDWELVVVVDGEEVFREAVAGQHWRTFTVDLGRFAGRTIDLELWNEAGGGDPWRNEHGYWDNVRLQTRPADGGRR
jgi:hypothetical protein